MDVFGLHVPAALAGAAATFAAVYAAFARLDADQSIENRQFVRAWLRGERELSPKTWSSFFVELFAKLFGPRHLSVRCARNSFILTLFLIGLVVTAKILKRGIYPWFEVGVHVPIALVGLTVVGIVTDYFSLWKTRFLLTKFPRVQSIAVLLLLIGIDFLAVTALYILIMLLVTASVISLAPDDQVYHPIMAAGITAPITISFIVRAFLGNSFFLLALLTSAWLWAYILVSCLIRLLYYVPLWMGPLSKIVDVDSHPVRSVGYIVAFICAIAVLSVMAI